MFEENISFEEHQHYQPKLDFDTRIATFRNGHTHINTTLSSLFFDTLYGTKIKSNFDLKKDIDDIIAAFVKKGKINKKYLLGNGFYPIKINEQQIKSVKYIYHLFDSVVCIVIGTKKLGFQFLVNPTPFSKQQIDELHTADIIKLAYATENAIIFKKTMNLADQIKKTSLRLTDLFSKKWHVMELADIRDIKEILKSVILETQSGSIINTTTLTNFHLKEINVNDVEELKYVYKLPNNVICFLVGNNNDGFRFMYRKLEKIGVYLVRMIKAGLITQFSESDEALIYITNENWKSEYFTFFTSD